ncbi:hypothetical protein D3C85_1615400 [compost metagenome]
MEHPRHGLPLSVSWDWLLEREFSECPGMSIDSEIQSLAHLVAEHLEQLNHKQTYELIVDFAIQSDKQIYLLGAEWEGPREVVHPYEIARHVIPYALKLWHTQKAIPAGRN